MYPSEYTINSTLHKVSVEHIQIMRKLSMLVLGVFFLTTAVGSGAVEASYKSDVDFDAKLALDQQVPVKVERQKIEKPKLSLDTKSEIPLTVNEKKKNIKIKPGESKKERNERKAREEAERKAAEEALRLEAAKRARVAAVHVTKQVPMNVNLQALYESASARFGIPWQILAAVHSAESGQRCYVPQRSYAGAQGPFQFMPSTFRAYAVDGDGDGVANIMNCYDAAHTAARYLAANDAGQGPAGVRNALWCYNHANWYVEKVLAIARGWGYQG